jgi:hypothetical protein
VDKPELYARLGVKEYFLFDPYQEYLEPPLQGYRLAGSTYARIAPEPSGALVSRELGLRLCLGEGVLQFYRLDTDERLLTRKEQARLDAERAEREREARQRETQRANQEAAARQAEAAARREAELELAKLREELARRPPPA